MRGSGVVQSLKSLASKLHPQLPLSPRESQRLLTALTSSFRAKLDEAHPPRAQDHDATPEVDNGRAVIPKHDALNISSVAFADKHLASVLTNPLLSKSDGPKAPVLNLDCAKSELERNPGRDPISVLEAYHEKDAATIPIATLCLRAFMDSLASLSTENRQVRVRKTQAGLRTLQWLWTRQPFETDPLADDRRLMEAVITMITEEDQEHFLWSWLRSDIKTDEQVKDVHNTKMASLSYRYRWKDFMLRLMVMNRWDNSTPASLNDVLDQYFKAVAIRREFAHISTNHIPLGSTVAAINARIFKFRDHRDSWDVKDYDRYMDTMSLVHSKENICWVDFRKALLRLTHPREPSPFPLYKTLKGSSLAESTSLEYAVYGSFAKPYDGHPKAQRMRHNKFDILLETMQQLKKVGYTEETEWLVSQIRALFPEQEQSLERSLAEGPRPPSLRHSRRDVLQLSLPSFTGAGTA